MRRQIQQELFEGIAHHWHQFMYPEMTADYEEKMRLRMNTDPLLRSRVERLTAGIMDLLDKHGLFDPASDRQSSEFSEFIRNASEEEKEKVFSRVIDEANEAQRAVESGRECRDSDHEAENSMCACPTCINEGWAAQEVDDE